MEVRFEAAMLSYQLDDVPVTANLYALSGNKT